MSLSDSQACATVRMRRALRRLPASFFCARERSAEVQPDARATRQATHSLGVQEQTPDFPNERSRAWVRRAGLAEDALGPLGCLHRGRCLFIWACATVTLLEISLLLLSLDEVGWGDRYTRGTAAWSHEIIMCLS